MVIYRGSGVLNFAHGAIGMVGAYVAWEVRYDVPAGSTAARPIEANPVWVAWRPASSSPRSSAPLAHLLIMRPLRRASPLARIVATLGLLIVLQSAAVLRYGARTTTVHVRAPARPRRTSSAWTSPSTASSCWASPSS